MTKKLLIIGGGPIGLACGIAAKNAGLDYEILEKGTIVNSLFNYPLYMTFFSTSERLEIGNIPFTCTKVKPGRQEAIEYYRKVVENQQLNIRLFCEVKHVEKQNNGIFKVETTSGNLFAENVIVATGYYDRPNLMHVPGEDLSKVRHYYKEPHEYAFQKVLVVGSQNSAVDAALQTFRKGAEVTLLTHSSVIGERVKYWIRPDMINRIAEGSIRTFFNSEVVEIQEKKVVVKDQSGTLHTLENDFVLAMTGYRPNNEFLRQIGVTFSTDGLDQPTYDETTMETNVSNLFLAGVVCGGNDTHSLMIENSRIHAELITKAILKQN